MALSRTPLHYRALGLFMIYTVIIISATGPRLQLALPSIRQDFHISVSTAAWVVIGYSLALTGYLTLGVVGTLFERRRLIVIGLLLDVPLELAIFFTGSIYVVIACRFVSAAVRAFPWLIFQVVGVGGFSSDRRGKAVGLAAVSQGAGLLLALPMTGFVVDHFGWRWLFFGSAVAHVAMVPLVFALLPKLPRTADLSRLRDLDYAGAALMMAGLAALITALQVFVRGIADNSLVVTLGLAGVICLTVFVWVELHARAPVLDFSLFRIPDVSLAASQAAVLGFANGAFLLMLPFVFVTGYGWTTVHASYILLFANITRPAVGPLSGNLADRYGTAPVILPMAVVSVAGQVVLSRLGASPLIALVICALLIWGTGQAFMQTANLRQIYAALPTERLHLAPSLNLLLMTLGSSAGQAIASIAVDKGRSKGTTGALINQIEHAMVIFTFVFVIAILITQVMPRLFIRRPPIGVPADTPVS